MLERSCNASTAALAALCLLLPAMAAATTLPIGFTETNVATGLSAPTAFAFTPDGRIFVCQQGGSIRVIDASGALLGTPLLSLTVDSDGERGLLGIELDPGFASNQQFYVYYTATTPTTHNRVSQFTADGNVADPDTEVVLLDLDNLSSATNHNGGAIHFGTDGKLYISTGENADASNAQVLTNLLGKILRINADGSIPSDNPFFNDPTPGVRKEIWAWGFRNPWRFTVQPGTGKLFIGDVGAGAWEEVDIGVAGGNFGWPCMEGNHAGPGSCAPGSTLVPAAFEYSHFGSGAAITGGDFYSGVTFPPQYSKVYFYGDSIDSFLRYLVLDSNNVVQSDNAFATEASGPVEIRYHDHAIWYTAINVGHLRRISFPARQPLAGDWDGNAAASIGLFRPTAGTFALRNANSSGAADLFYGFGPRNPSWAPLAGDWDGNLTETPGLHDRKNGLFYLRNSNTAGNADVVLSFGPGGTGVIALAGDWDGDGDETVGIYEPATGVFFLRNSNTSGPADLAFTFGGGGTAFIPLVGDWDGNGTTTAGLYDSATSNFFLRNSNSAGAADLTFTFGGASPNYVPLAGNWDGSVGESIGLYNRQTGVFFLRNTNSAGSADLAFNFGVTGQ